MNYYYEFPKDVSVFGQPGGGIYCLPNQSIAHGHRPNYTVQDYALKYATRVWLENDNGVTLTKAPPNDVSFGRVDMKEFVMIKLKARIIPT